MYERKMNYLKSMIGMICATTLDCLNRRIGTTKKQTNIAQRIEKKRSFNFYFDYIVHRNGMIDMDMYYTTSDHSRIHFSKRNINTNIYCTEN